MKNATEKQVIKGTTVCPCCDHSWPDVLTIEDGFGSYEGPLDCPKCHVGLEPEDFKASKNN